MFFTFLAVILVPELSRKGRETRGIHFHQFSSIYVLVVPSYDDLTEFSQIVGLYLFGFPVVCSCYPSGFRKVREAGGFHASNFRPNPTTGVRVMTPKPKKLTTIKLLN